jgi:vitamin B12 transporter
VYASWGEGFRAPNLNELYSPGFGGLFAGNPNLDPERSRSLELGLEARLADFDWGLNAYRTRIDGLIAFQGGSIYQAVNIARAAIDGVELTARRSFGDWQLNANATWQDPRDARSGSALLRRPARKAYVDLAYQWDERFSISGDLGYTSERSDFAGDLRAYALLGVSANWTLSSDWQLGARLSNLTDHEYRWARGFAAPGRELLLSVSWYANP